MSEKKYDFIGKVVLVTGSSSGIGATIASKFAKYGAMVVITGRDSSRLNDVARKIESISTGSVLPIIGDLADRKFPKLLMEKTIEHFKRLDILINNAGTGCPNDSLEDPEMIKHFDQMFHVNVRSAIQLIQLAMPHLERTKGNVINISSVASIRPIKLLYGATKAALDSVTKMCAVDLSPKGIRVNSINAGPIIDTRFVCSMGYDHEAVRDKLKTVHESLTLLGKAATPDDVANLACFLASDSDAGNITGSSMVTDAGLLLKF